MVSVYMSNNVLYSSCSELNTSLLIVIISFKFKCTINNLFAVLCDSKQEFVVKTVGVDCWAADKDLEGELINLQCTGTGKSYSVYFY